MKNLTKLIQQTAEKVRKQKPGTGQEVASVLAWKYTGPATSTVNPLFDRIKKQFENAVKRLGPHFLKEGMELEVYDEGMTSTHPLGPQVFLRFSKPHPQD
jgi:hypothetical protein